MIRVGIGGWTFEPWRGAFYPKGTAKARELAYASRAVTTIEINGTFYSTFKPDTFKRWADETPDNFVFSLKANRFAVNRKVLRDAGPSIERFLTSGLSELKSKLGPILWQMAPTKRFDAEDFAGFLALLPKSVDGMKLRHALEVRHEGFRDPTFTALAKKAGAAIVFADSEKYPAIDEATADFVYARLQRAEEKHATGYSTAAIKNWAAKAHAWEGGGKNRRDVFVYMINGAKVRAPAAAMALLKVL
jgi:uncharacterized protein YecE (DUF72 family)